MEEKTTQDCQIVPPSFIFKVKESDLPKDVMNEIELKIKERFPNSLVIFGEVEMYQLGGSYNRVI